MESGLFGEGGREGVGKKPKKLHHPPPHHPQAPYFSAVSFLNTKSYLVSTNTILIKISLCLEYNEEEESDSIIFLRF